MQQLNPSEISDIIKTEYGYHIIKVDKVLAGRTLPLKDVKDKIQFILSSKKQNSAYEEWMNELRKSAFIENTLFEKPKKYTNLFSSKNYRRLGDGSTKSNDLSQKKSLSTNNTKNRRLQDKWEEMYKSVEKSKQTKKDQNGSPFQSLEQKLQRIKELRSDEMITETEYQRRKKKLLNNL